MNTVNKIIQQFSEWTYRNIADDGCINMHTDGVYYDPSNIYEYLISKVCKSGNLHMVPFLIEHGADPNAFDGIAVRTAVIDQDIPMIKYLLDHGAKLDIDDHTRDYLSDLDYNSAIHVAITQNFTELLQYVFINTDVNPSLYESQLEMIKDTDPALYDAINAKVMIYQLPQAWFEEYASDYFYDADSVYYQVLEIICGAFRRGRHDHQHYSDHMFIDLDADLDPRDPDYMRHLITDFLEEKTPHSLSNDVIVQEEIAVYLTEIGVDYTNFRDLLYGAIHRGYWSNTLENDDVAVAYRQEYIHSLAELIPELYQDAFDENPEAIGSVFSTYDY